MHIQVLKWTLMHKKAAALILQIYHICIILHTVAMYKGDNGWYVSTLHM